METTTYGGPAFNILGQLKVRGHAGDVALPAARGRTLLALLLTRANRVVSVDEIIDRMWDHRPATARAQVLTVVSSLRRALGDTAVSPDRRLLITNSPGYLLRVEDHQLDASRFESLLARVDRDRLTGEAAITVLQEALSLWRGPALADVPAPFATVEAHRLEELRLSAVVRAIQCEIDLGRPVQTIARLTELVAEHPFCERLRGLLMTALHRSGRTAQALEVYRSGRQVMVEELGIEPGHSLRQLERAILTEELAEGLMAVDAHPPTDPRQTLDIRPAQLPAVDHPAPVSVPAFVPPAQLPADILDFTGRVAETRQLTSLLAAGDDVSLRTAVPIVVVTGPSGVGKSTIVRHVGHLLQSHFPDGQLDVALRGGQERPADPSDILEQVLVALGVNPVVIPGDPEARAQLYRSVTAGRRLLVVLDDAASAAQVRPLLPGGAGCAVAVTSRWGLTDLEGARVLQLGPLPTEDALALFATLVGSDRVAAETSAAQRIVAFCDRSPLAVRVAGARLAARPHWPLSHLANRLADENRRLDELCQGDLSVRASLALSFRGLDPDTDRAGRILALLGPPVFSAAGVAATLRIPLAVAEQRLDRLMQRHIIEAVGPDRYRFPDLLRLCLRGIAMEVHPGLYERTATGRAERVKGLEQVVRRPAVAAPAAGRSC